MSRILNLKDVSVTYVNNDKRVYAVDKVSTSIDVGDSIGIVGESGSGKSTLAMAILRLLPPTTLVDGNIEYRNTDLLNLPEDEFNKLRWKDISVVFQKSMNTLSPIHKIGDQFQDIFRVHDKSMSQSEVKELIIKKFELVNLAERVYDLYPHELSGGMLQRASIALSLLHEPPVVILDEATTALDVVTQTQILNEIKILEEKIDMTRIMITHDMSVVSTACKKVIVMYAGRLMESGLVKDVIMNPRHPYTKGLISSYPSLKGEKVELKGIRGALPDLSKKHEGCIFAPRCDYAKDICFKKRPLDNEVKPNHYVSCHFAKGD